MKTSIFTSIFILAAFLIAEAQYVIDFANPTTYQISCGNVVSSQWSVKNQTCELHLPPLVLASSSSLNVKYDIRINQSGNLDPEDKVVVYYKINSGSWAVDSIISGDNTNAVRIVSGSIPISVADTVNFKVVMVTNANNEFWSVKSGDIKVQNVIPIYFPLPVELYGFEGYYSVEKGSNIISWATVSEVNNSHFTLLKSIDGANFILATVMNGAGNSNVFTSYSYQDFDVAGVTYYKLTQTDFDGTVKEFDPIVVEKDNMVSDGIRIDEIINSESGIYVSLFSAVSGQKWIRLFSTDGQLLYNEEINLESGLNRIDIDFQNTSGSMAILQINGDNNISVNKKFLMAY